MTQEERVTFPSGELTLEGVWHRPAGQGPFPGVALCHPHPQYGGSMDNNVVFSVALALAESSIAALRFNFRGVGGSGGSFASGVGEGEDLQAALSFIAASPFIDPTKLGVAGYSFGASVALAVALGDARVKAVALISLPLGTGRGQGLEGLRLPKLLVSGDQDPYSPGEEMESRAAQLPPPTEWEVIAGADHFWWGYEGMLGGRVARFLAHFLS